MSEKREIAARAKMLKFEGETEQVRRLAEDVLTLLGRVDEAEASLDAAWATAFKEQHRVFEVLALAADLEQERPSSSAWRGAYRNVAKRIRVAVGAPERDFEAEQAEIRKQVRG